MAVRHSVQRFGAFRSAHDALLRVCRGEFVQHAEDGFVQREINHLPLARLIAVAQRHQHANRPVKPGDVIGERCGARRHRRPSGHAGQVHKPRIGMGDSGETGSVAVRAVLPVAGHPQQDEFWIDPGQHVPAQPPFLQRARAEIFTKHVGLRDEFFQDFHAFGSTQIERQ